MCEYVPVCAFMYAALGMLVCMECIYVPVCVHCLTTHLYGSAQIWKLFTHTHTHTHTHISHIETSTNPLATPLYDAYLGAMRNASGTPNTNPSFSASLAAEADFEEYCELALPDVCAAHFRWAKNVCVCASVWLIGQTC